MDAPDARPVEAPSSARGRGHREQILDEVRRGANWITPALVRQQECAAGSGSLVDRHPTWWMRRNVALDSVAGRMHLAIVCLGYYELYVNGERVGDEPLAPSISRLDRRGLCVVHDVTGRLREGENNVAVWCGSGWYLPHQFKVHEGWSPLLLVKGFACSDDGKLEKWLEGDEAWLCREANRWVVGTWSWNDFGGEQVDGRSALPDWNAAGASTEDWHRATMVSPPPIEISLRTCPPNRIGETYPARSVRRLDDGRFEVDFGTCLTGWIDIRFAGLARGQTVTMRFGDLPADNDTNRDHTYNQRSIYHARGGGEDRFTNKFNYAGFRYVTIEGVAEPPELDDMRALLVESALERVGGFRCSNGLFNRIHDLNVDTLRCLNLGGYTVDCPHRERNGYGADAQTAIPAYLYTMDSHAFLRKWLVDWCDVYEPETGRIPLCAPTHHGQEAPAWGGVVAPLAWNLYLYYGDRESLKNAFDVILGHLRYLQGFVEGGVLRFERMGRPFHGDWVPARRGMDTKRKPDVPMRELFNSCYLAYLWRIFVKICSALSREEFIPEAERNLAALREGVHGEFFDEGAGLYLMAEQAYQAMPLLAGAVPTELRSSIQERLVGLIAEQGWHMDTGLPGTTFLLDVLAQCGEHEAIARIYAQETYPGWGHMLASGATTIWEQWNGYWSRIHSCFAGPAAWLYSGLAGIRPDEAGPGFESFILAPAFVRDIDLVEASYDSIRGRIESRWRREDGEISWSVAVPAGSGATVRLPIADPAGLTIDGRALDGEARRTTDAKGEAQIRFRLADGAHVLQWAEA